MIFFQFRFYYLRGHEPIKTGVSIRDRQVLSASRGSIIRFESIVLCDIRAGRAILTAEARRRRADYYIPGFGEATDVASHRKPAHNAFGRSSLE